MYFSDGGYESMDMMYGADGNVGEMNGRSGGQQGLNHGLGHHHGGMYMPQHMMGMPGPPPYMTGPQGNPHGHQVHMNSMPSHGMSHHSSSGPSLRVSAEVPGMHPSNVASGSISHRGPPVFYSQGQSGPNNALNSNAASGGSSSQQPGQSMANMNSQGNTSYAHNIQGMSVGMGAPSGNGQNPTTQHSAHLLSGHSSISNGHSQWSWPPSSPSKIQSMGSGAMGPQGQVLSGSGNSALSALSSSSNLSSQPNNLSSQPQTQGSQSSANPNMPSHNASGTSAQSSMPKPNLNAPAWEFTSRGPSAPPSPMRPSLTGPNAAPNSPSKFSSSMNAGNNSNLSSSGHMAPSHLGSSLGHLTSSMGHMGSSSGSGGSTKPTLASIVANGNAPSYFPAYTPSSASNPNNLSSSSSVSLSSSNIPSAGYQDASGVYIPSSKAQQQSSSIHTGSSGLHQSVGSSIHQSGSSLMQQQQHSLNGSNASSYHPSTLHSGPASTRTVNPMEEYIAASLKRSGSLSANSSPLSTNNALAYPTSGSNTSSSIVGAKLQASSGPRASPGPGRIQGNPGLVGAKSSHPKSHSDTLDWPILDLSMMKLHSVAPQVSYYSHLSGIYLQHNCLITLPSELCTLPNLKFMDLSHNQISWLPQEIGQLISLKELFLAHNQLRGLPVEVGKLFRLARITLDDNPLHDLPQDVLASGASAIVAHMRELLAPLDPPPPRSWTLSSVADRTYTVPSYFQNLELSLGSKSVRSIEGAHKVVSVQTSDAAQFRIEGSVRCMSYNILADCYAMSLHYCPTWALSWAHRKTVVLKEIDMYEPDVLCLQEVELGQYRTYFLPEMTRRGYLSIFHPKSRIKYASDANRVDGCATFYRQEMFEEVQRFTIEFQQMARDHPERYCTPGDDAGYNRLLSKDNIAVGFVLRRLDKPIPAPVPSTRNGKGSYGASGPKGSAARRSVSSQLSPMMEEEDNLFIFVNTHIYWDPDFSDVKLMQVQMALESLEEYVDSYSSPNRRVPLVLGGDFNSMPDSAVYTLLSEGYVPGDHREFLGYSYGPYTENGLRHGLELRSSNGTLSSEPEFTNYTGDFSGALDYIWYSDDTLSVERTLNGVEESVVISYNGALPNQHMPSDHIPLVADFVQNRRE